MHADALLRRLDNATFTDVGADVHARVERCERAARLLGQYAFRHRTFGVLTASQIQDALMPAMGGRDRFHATLRWLKELGLLIPFTDAPKSYGLLGYLHKNPTRKQLEQRRERRNARDRARHHQLI